MGDDTEIKALREEALDVIMKLPKEKTNQNVEYSLSFFFRGQKQRTGVFLMTVSYRYD